MGGSELVGERLENCKLALMKRGDSLLPLFTGTANDSKTLAVL